VRRSPIILTATIAGTAGVLAFHPHTPAVKTATASTPSAASTPAATAATPTQSSTSSASSGVSGTATGDAVDTQYGAAQVRVTVQNGKIVKLEALQLQANDPRSVQISSSAAPILQQEILTAQSANVDAVSGASYTSASYLQSAQSALDKLGYVTATG
jgi:uncharacterized protein with FMN-binding domain